MNREERQQARTDRYRELADNARKQSEQCFRQSESMASVIPMGQPVHGKADRNYREKIWNKMGQSVKASEKADYYERKAEAAENNNAIYLDDDNAVEKLERKLAELVKAQEDMKAANKVVKNKKLTEEEKKVRLMELGYSIIRKSKCSTDFKRNDFLKKNEAYPLGALRSLKFAYRKLRISLFVELAV